MKLNFDEIKPIFNISFSNETTIKEIENLLTSIKINDKSHTKSIISSLAIEGNSLSLDEVNNIYNKKTVYGSKKDIQEVKNAIELYENINKYNWRKEKDLNKAQATLVKYFDEDNGKYRSHGEGIKKGNKIVFQAPESIFVPSLMKSLFKYLKDNEDTIHPLILSSIFHYYFVYIHPYTDGNGRTARFWVSLMLTDYNEAFAYLPIEETIYKHQKQYYKSIDSCHVNGNANAFIDYMLSIIKETIINNIKS